MKIKLSKKLFTYSLIIFVVLVLSAVVLTQVMTNIYVLLSVFVIDFIIFNIMLFHFFDKYIKPIEKASSTMDKLLQGNYHARINQEMNGTIGELSAKINTLAGNLSKLTIQEQIQAEQLSTVIENSESALAFIDERGYVHVVNRKFVSIFGNQPKHYIGHIYYDVMDHEMIHRTVQEVFLYEKRVKQLISIENEQENTYLEIVGAPIFNERNMLKGAVLVIYDITEFKNVELMRKDFVANVSHELQTPIMSIKDFAKKAIEEPEGQQVIKNIYEESNRLQLLMDDLLILSDLEKDDTQLQLSTVHTNTLLDDMKPMIQPLASKKDIHLQIDTDETLTFSADREKLEQILLNLMMNAITYTSVGGNVVLKIKKHNDKVRFKVQDSGIGISKLALPRIFERFYRVDKDRSRDTGGTGLGLAIVKHIVEVHHGDIFVESELDKGTCFTIDLPMNGQIDNE